MGQVEQTGKLIKKYNSIDLFKFFMAICVIAVHTDPMVAYKGTFLYSIYWEFIYVGVAFFFIASGFLMADKFDENFSSQHNQDIVRKTLKHIIFFYIDWTIIYLPLTIYQYVSEGTSLLSSIYEFIIGFVVIGEHYNSWQLWYLLSTVYALIFILLMMKAKAGRKTLFTVSAIIMLLSTLITLFTDYTGDLPHSLVIIRSLFSFIGINGRILRGLFFIPVGICIQKIRLGKPLSVALYIGGFVLSLIFQSEAIHRMLDVLTAVGLFEFALSINLKDSAIYPKFRKMSTSMYFIHMYIWTAFYTMIYHTQTFGFTAFIVTVLASIIISLSCNELNTKYVIFKSKRNIAS